jgi:hypothetical protein
MSQEQYGAMHEVEVQNDAKTAIAQALFCKKIFY